MSFVRLVARRAFAASAPLVLLLACGADASTGPSTDTPFEGGLTVARSELRAFHHVHVVDTDAGTVARDQVVVVRDGRIDQIGPATAVSVPAGADVVDGGGAWLMPGLLDMHVHMSSADAEAYVRSGITTVRNMWGFVNLQTIRSQIDAGTRIGPSIHTLSSGLDGPPVRWPETQLLVDASKADSVVGRMWSLGYRELKVYQSLSAAVYDAIVVAAAARGMTFAGHKPAAVPLTHVLESGQRSIEHLGGYAQLSGAALDDAIRLTVEHGAWNCPTLAIQTVLPAAAQGAAYRRTVTGALHEAGARLLIGTDSGIEVTQPGVSLVEEMEEFRRAGVSLPELLRIVTVGGAEYLGLTDRIGKVAVGLDADLVLLAGNPLEDLNALRRPLGVHRADAWIDMR